MTRSCEDNRQLFLKKASQITDQKHFDACMELFPESMRQEMYEAVQSLLKKPFTLKRPQP